MQACEFLDQPLVHSLVESEFGHHTILVIGDLMLDRHIWGSVNRISPEAPVPVVRQQRQTLVAGGAGNVAMNLSGLGLTTRLVGLIGKDEAADQLLAELVKGGVETTRMVVDEHRPTTTKTRVIGGHQQMLRLDNESADPASAEAEAALLQAIEQGMADASAIILSDYAKGVLTASICQATIRMARNLGIPVLVDPKGSDWSKYRGADLITPNRSELSTVVGRSLGSIDSVIIAARDLLGRLELKGITVTLSEEGMLQVSQGGEIRMPAMAKEVFDVSGAGDTAIATLTASLSCGLSTHDSLLLANLAAGVVVGKVGTVPLGPGELLDALDSFQRFSTNSKVHSLASAKPLVRTWKTGGKKLVFTNGCFDILHAGHVSYLSKARGLGDRLIVGLNSDSSVRRLKGPNRPINDQTGRAMVLAGLESIDAIVVFDEDTPLELIRELQPDVLAKGADYKEEDVVGAKEVRSWGGEVRLVELVDGVSTTIIANRISAN